ncbi:MAG TPA: hypothetical protein VMT42_05205 [candidate division Zixibacteria bacterium]|nr:hypothetical protein [candidate division Zixibacteria bacterium]
MPLDKSELLNFLEELNKELGRKITLIAVGGTAMTLLDLKPSTMDIDFTIPSSDFPEYKRAEKRARSDCVQNAKNGKKSRGKKGSLSKARDSNSLVDVYTAENPWKEDFLHFHPLRARGRLSGHNRTRKSMTFQMLH